MVKTLSAGLPLRVAATIAALVASALVARSADEIERELGAADAF